MSVVLCTIGYGGWYPRGVARLVDTVKLHSEGIQPMAWINTVPFGAPTNVIEDNWDYSAYCAKPYALAAARNSGADIAIWADAAFFAIRDIWPIVEHCARTGYMLVENGYKVGEWSSDRCLERMGIERERAWEMDEVSSYCVGLNFADGRCTELLHRWMGFSADRLTVPGKHHSDPTGTRSTGFVSTDTRVRGHRHDQTVLSVLAYQMGLTERVHRPQFTAYSGHETGETVLVNQGGAW